MPTQSGSTQVPRPRAALALLGWLTLCFAVTAASFTIAAHSAGWYAGLIKPPLNPPGWMTAPASIVLTALMAISAWLVWRTRPSVCRVKGLRLFAVMLWFNLLWSWIFFSRHQIGTALVDLVVLLVAVLLTIVNFMKVSRTAAWLLVPYLAWVAFAIYLNLAFWRLN
jgi:translocator protein